MKKTVIRNSEPFYRVSHTYILKSIEYQGRHTRDLQSLDKAIEYMNYRKSVGTGRDFTIEKVVTTYEVVASG